MLFSDISIIMPVLNEAAFITDQLSRLQPLRKQGVELVVVDGGSSDGTPDLALPLADRLLASPRGRATQMNAGAAASRGRALLFLHADTRLPATAIQDVLAAVKAGAIWGRFDVRIDGRHPLLRLVERMINLRSRLTGIATGDQALFVRRPVFESIGGYARLPLMEDIDLSTRLKRIARPACLSACVLTSARRWQQHGVLSTIVLMGWLRAAYFFGADPKRLAERYGYAPRPR